MRQRIYVECPRIVGRSIRTDNGTIDGEDNCRWDVSVIVTTTFDGQTNAELEFDECDSCNSSWTPSEEEAMLNQAIRLSTPIKCETLI